jgi:COP9 signalosome complex subunit 5
MSQQQGESSTARARWELENAVQQQDALFKYDAQQQRDIQTQRPWTKDPHYFKQ